MSQTHSHHLAPPNIPPVTARLLASPVPGPEGQASILLPQGRELRCPHSCGRSQGCSWGTPGARAQPPGMLAACPQLTWQAEYRAELHKVSAE